MSTAPSGRRVALKVPPECGAERRKCIEIYRNRLPPTAEATTSFNVPIVTPLGFGHNSGGIPLNISVVQIATMYQAIGTLSPAPY